MSFKTSVVGLVFLLSLAPQVAAEQSWGSLTGKVTLVGQPPKLPQLNPGTDRVCCQANPQDQSLVLGEDQAIANLVIYLRPQRGGEIAVHPDFETIPSEPAELDNKGCAFVPHVVLVRVGQPLLLLNSDPTAHSIKCELGDEAFNTILAPEGEQRLALRDAQRVPRPVACTIHPFMRGWLLVRDDPYMTATNVDGEFTIEKLPAGEHEFQFWHERPGYLKNCASDVAQLDRRGRLTVTIEPNATTDLGTIRVPTALMNAEGE